MQKNPTQYLMKFPQTRDSKDHLPLELESELCSPRFRQNPRRPSPSPKNAEKMRGIEKGGKIRRIGVI